MNALPSTFASIFFFLVGISSDILDDINEMSRRQLFELVKNDKRPHLVRFRTCEKGKNNLRHDQNIYIWPEWINKNDDLALQEYEFAYIGYHFEIDKSKASFDIQNLTIFPYAAYPGEVLIIITAKKKANSLRIDLPKDIFGESGYKLCVLNLKPYNPVALIEGGASRVVASSSDIHVDGSLSYDKNFKDRSHKGLKFYWTCKQTLQPPTFCKSGIISKEKRFTIPKKFVKEGDSFKITLTLKSAFTTTAAKQQTVTVKSGVANLMIICRKNCPPEMKISSIKARTIFKVNCKQNCGGINETTDYIWTIKSKTNPDFSFDYKKKSRFGRIGPKFVIKPNALKTDTYTVSVSLGPKAIRTGTASFEIKFGELEGVKSCSIDPKTGQTLVTKFRLVCIQVSENDTFTYELYGRDKKDPTIEEFLIGGNSPEIFTKTFPLPTSENSNFVVKVMRKGEPKREIPLDVVVTSSLGDKDSEEALGVLKDYYKESDISAGVASNSSAERQKALQNFNVLVDEVMESVRKNEKVDEFIRNLKLQAASDFSKSPLDTINEVLQVSNTITNLHIQAREKELPKADPELAEATTKICKKMSHKFLELLKKEKYPLTLDDKALQHSRIVEKCVQTYGNADYTLVAPKEYNLTQLEIIKQEFEQYENFDEKYFENMQKLKESSLKSIKTASTTAKSVAMTRAVGDDEFRMNGSISSVVVLKDEGKYLVKKVVTSHGVVLIPPKEFAGDSHPYDILMVTWNRDIMWWNPGKIHVDTDIAKIEFWHSTCKQHITHFKKPVHIFFKVRNDGTKILNRMLDTYDVPENIETIKPFRRNYLVKVYRIALPRLRKLHLRFFNLTIPKSLKFVVKFFEYPEHKDFKRSVTMRARGKQYYVRNSKTYDIWIYIGIFPLKGFAGRSIDYGLEWYGSSCLKWHENKTVWQASGCQAGPKTNLTTVHCLCSNFSLLAGYLENYPVEPQQVIRPNIVLRLISCYVIFITVCTTYCIFYLLIFFTLRERRKKQLFFLADNNLEHPFAYLLLIKTGHGYNSGTSSNIMIKLIGSKKSSEPHVLNFPDPKLQLLQSFGNDMFVMTTESHLGEIRKVELWFDSTGPNASWHCRNILVYDMQLRQEWNFPIKTDLSLRRGTTRLIVTSDSEQEKDKGFLSMFNIRIFSQRYHTWCFFRYEEHLSFLKKITIVLSNCLMTYVFVMLFYTLPEMHLHDSLDSRQALTIESFDVFVAFVGYIIPFLLHNGIAWIFRNTQRQFSRYRYTNKLPVSVNFTLWGILIFMIIFSTTLLIVFGFWVQFYSSCVWLMSCIIGLLLAMTIYETLWSMVLNMLYKMEIGHNIEKMFNDIKDGINLQRAYLYKQFGTLVLRPYFEHLYKPLKVRDVMVKKLLLRRRLSIIAELEDLVMFTIYITILYITILSNKDFLTIYGRKEMSEIVQGLFTRTFGFSNINDGQDIIRYLNDTLILAVHPFEWYGNYSIIDSTKPNVVDLVNKLVGVVRIRQQRMMPNLCEVAPQMRFLNMSCWPEFSQSMIETKRHGYAWGEYTPYLVHDRLGGIWEYQPEYKTQTLAHIGQFAIYSGGGYIMYLGRNYFNSYLNSHIYRILCYNPNVNTFNAVKLLFEQSATGFIEKSVYVFPARMLYVGNEAQIVSFVFMFVIWVFFMLMKQIVATVKGFPRVFKDLWFLIDCFIITMSVLCISVFSVRTYMVRTYWNQLEHVEHKFVNYFHLFYIEDVLSYVAGFLICTATIRLWKFLRFASMFRKLELTFIIAGNAFMSFAVAFFLLLFTFAMAINMVMGNYFKKVYTVPRTARMMTTLALKPLEMELHRFLVNKVATIYITLYMVVVQISMFVLIMIIVMAYIEAQMQIASEVFKYSIYNYLEERMKYIPRYFKYKFKRRARAGFEELLKVTPKPDKIIYLFCKIVTSNRMMAMKYLTKCLVTNKNRKKTGVLSEYNSRLMLKVCRSVLIKPEEQEVEVFYKGRVQGQRLKFVDERRVEQIANIVNLLLQDRLLEFSQTGIEESTIEKCARSIKQDINTLQRCNLQLKLILHKWFSIEASLKKVLKR
ncbi:hypothetical protein TcasGA2_TC034270 [Tribolium castaneum]|uniref:PLAT domain-containing protein n=1 Tax=Tribolium castaneum TaxID=7070 RepID=A0A139WCS3_TRICA|nr:hypothetical protein TcasGA2_TC034270 [Tribolium castaneum]